MRAGQPLSLVNSAVASVATQVFAPSAAGQVMGTGHAVIRDIRVVQGAAHTNFTLNSFNPEGAGTATARFGVARPATTASNFTGLNLAFPLGHGATAITVGAGADTVLQLDGDRVDGGSIAHLKSAFQATTEITTTSMVAGGANRRIVLTRVIISSAAAGTAIRIGYDDDGLGGNFVPLTPDIIDGVGDFTFTSKIPVVAGASKFVSLDQTTGAADCTAYIEYTLNADEESVAHIKTAVGSDTEAGGGDTAFITLRDTAAAEDLELMRAMLYSSAAASTVTVGYADDTAGANYVPLTGALANGNRIDTLAFVIPVGKKLLARHVSTGPGTVRAHVEYRILSS